MNQNPQILWITDPWNTLDYSGDTTLRLMEEAFLQGVKQYWCDVKTLRFKNGKVVLDTFPILSINSKRESDSFDFGPMQISSPEEFRSIHYRTDPPVDLAYLHPLQLLAFGLRDQPRVEVVNPLSVLFSMNEKLEGSSIAHLTPTSIVSSQWDRLSEFGIKEGVTVLKPLYLAQSIGIDLLEWKNVESSEQARVKLVKATNYFTAPVMLQRYLPGIAEGETRLWFVDGQLLAHAKKVPQAGDFRINMDGGSRLVLHTLTKKEEASILAIGKELNHHKIRLAAVDLIEGLITDFNFTSPGLIPKMESLLQKNLAGPILKALSKSSY